MSRVTTGWIPKEYRATLKCIECGEEKPPSEFNTHGTTKSGHKAYNSRCKLCGNRHAAKLPSGQIKYRGLAAQKRELLVSTKIKCVVCGYNKCADAMDCHHIDESTKLFDVSKAVTSPSIDLPTFQAELDKCVVLCARCHREYHAGIDVVF